MKLISNSKNILETVFCESLQLSKHNGIDGRKRFASTRINTFSVERLAIQAIEIVCFVDIESGSVCVKSYNVGENGVTFQVW